MNRFIDKDGAIAAHHDIPLPAGASASPINSTLSSPEVEPAPPARSRHRAPSAAMERASSPHTLRAYTSDWKHFSGWCRRRQHPTLPADPHLVALYIAACASGAATTNQNGLATIKRRLSSLVWNYSQRGLLLDRGAHQIADALSAARGAAPSSKKARATVGEDGISAMLETLDRGTLRGLRDRAILLLGSAGGLRRSEIVGLDAGRDQTTDGCGWIELRDEGLVLTLLRRTGWHTVRIPPSDGQTACPVSTLQTWLHLAKIDRGPLFRRVIGRGRMAGPQRLNAQEVARLVKRTALAAGIGPGVSAQCLLTRPASWQKMIPVDEGF